MTSEPDSKPERRPPTIELTAREVETEKPAATAQAGTTAPERDGAAAAEAPEKSAGAASTGRLGLHAISAAGGALVMAAILAGLWFAGYAPSRSDTASSGAPAAPASNGTAIDDIAARLEKIQGALQAKQPDTALPARITATEAETKSLGDSIAALNRRLDDIAASAQGAVKQADAASAAASAATDSAKTSANAGVQHGDLDALAKRMTALEGAVKTLSDNVARRPASADDRTARLTVATEALRDVVERGAPYQAELTAAKSLGADQNLTGQLEPFAADGVPTAPALGHELAMLTPALLRATNAVPNQGTFLQRLELNAQKLVRVTPVDAPVGNDPADVIARIDIDAAHANIAGALADIAQLPDSARPLTADWVKKAEARNAAVAASRRIAADALAALSKPAPQ